MPDEKPENSYRIEFTYETKESQLLREQMGITVQDFSKVLSKYAEAALQEYLDLFLGKTVFSRASDIKEYRLFLLSKYVFKEIPDELKVSTLFHLKPSEAKTLLKSLEAKYKIQLKDIFTSTLKALIESIPKSDGKSNEIRFVCKSEYKINQLNVLLTTHDESGCLEQIIKNQGTTNTYLIKPSTLKKLRDLFNIQN